MVYNISKVLFRLPSWARILGLQISELILDILAIKSRDYSKNQVITHNSSDQIFLPCLTGQQLIVAHNAETKRLFD